MIQTVGLLGAGNMGGALFRGLGKQEGLSLYVYDIDAGRAKALAVDCGAVVAADIHALAAGCDVILLAVKPDTIAPVLRDISDLLRPNAIVISIAAGWTSAQLRALLPDSTRVVRVMPNMPALVGAGMCCVAEPEGLSTDEKEMVLRLFSSVGRAVLIDESKMEAITGVSGSGPAYVFLFIEAMADAGVLEGLPRALAQELAAQTLLGAAKMVLETGKHPGVLKDSICSPGGTTIEAVHTLEQQGFRGAVMDAVVACANKARSMMER